MSDLALKIETPAAGPISGGSLGTESPSKMEGDVAAQASHSDTQAENEFPVSAEAGETIPTVNGSVSPVKEITMHSEDGLKEALFSSADQDNTEGETNQIAESAHPHNDETDQNTGSAPSHNSETDKVAESAPSHNDEGEQNSESVLPYKSETTVPNPEALSSSADQDNTEGETNEIAESAHPHNDETDQNTGSAPSHNSETDKVAESAPSHNDEGEQNSESMLPYKSETAVPNPGGLIGSKFPLKVEDEVTAEAHHSDTDVENEFPVSAESGKTISTVIDSVNPVHEIMTHDDERLNEVPSSNADQDTIESECLPPHNSETNEIVESVPPRNDETNQNTELAPAHNSEADQNTESVPPYNGETNQITESAPPCNSETGKITVQAKPSGSICTDTPLIVEDEVTTEVSDSTTDVVNGSTFSAESGKIIPSVNDSVSPVCEIMTHDEGSLKEAPSLYANQDNTESEPLSPNCETNETADSAPPYNGETNQNTESAPHNSEADQISNSVLPYNGKTDQNNDLVLSHHGETNLTSDSAIDDESRDEKVWSFQGTVDLWEIDNEGPVSSVQQLMSHLKNISDNSDQHTQEADDEADQPLAIQIDSVRGHVPWTCEDEADEDIAATSVTDSDNHPRFLGSPSYHRNSVRKWCPPLRMSKGAATAEEHISLNFDPVDLVQKVNNSTTPSLLKITTLGMTVEKADENCFVCELCNYREENPQAFIEHCHEEKHKHTKQATVDESIRLYRKHKQAIYNAKKSEKNRLNQSSYNTEERKPCDGQGSPESSVNDRDSDSTQSNTTYSSITNHSLMTAAEEHFKRTGPRRKPRKKKRFTWCKRRPAMKLKQANSGSAFHVKRPVGRPPKKRTYTCISEDQSSVKTAKVIDTESVNSETTIGDTEDIPQVVDGVATSSAAHSKGAEQLTEPSAQTVPLKRPVGRPPKKRRLTSSPKDQPPERIPENRLMDTAMVICDRLQSVDGVELGSSLGNRAEQTKEASPQALPMKKPRGRPRKRKLYSEDQPSVGTAENKDIDTVSSISERVISDTEDYPQYEGVDTSSATHSIDAAALQSDVDKKSREKLMHSLSVDELWGELNKRKTAHSCVCGYSFSNTAEFYLHKSCHNTDEQRKCSYCDGLMPNWMLFHAHFLHHKKP